MINKFQQGGKQQDLIMQFIQGLAQTMQVNPEQIAQISEKNPQALQSAIEVFQQTQDMQQAAQAFQRQIQSAKHGAKLQYIRSLKNKCSDDEELYYFKKGGSLGCGCKKKENGGMVEKAQKGTVVDKFKKDQATKDSIAANVHNDQEVQTQKPGSYKKNKQGKLQWTPDRTQAPYNKTSKKEKGGELKGKVCPKCGKVHAAGMGCAVAKFKMNRQGGKLN